MKFRTEVIIQDTPKDIEYNDYLMFIGSCFSNNIGNKFINNRFNCIINPNGVVYNPESVALVINSIINNKKTNINDLHYINDNWVSFSHHSTFSNPDKKECLNKINENTETAHNHLKKCKYIFITFGTSWVYKLIENNQIVANCHKYPENNFKRYLLNINKITESYNKLIKKLTLFNKNIKIVFTVSPIRHWKDGAHNNQISKSTLILSIYNICKNNPNCSYFPSYEIMNDDLRDYRFYNDDMLHPNSMAVEYIWNKIKETYLHKNSIEYIKEISKIIKFLNHKPINKNNKNYLLSINKTLKKIEYLSHNYPYVSFDKIKQEIILKLS